MPALTLTLAHRRDLSALSHGIRPVVWIGASGLSETVIRELDLALKSHELIKVRVTEGERETREAMLEEICQRLGAAAVRHIGRILMIYRPNPNEQRIKEDREDGRKNSRRKNDGQLKG